jgi:hypothetical protein
MATPKTTGDKGTKATAVQTKVAATLPKDTKITAAQINAAAKAGAKDTRPVNDAYITQALKDSKSGIAMGKQTVKLAQEQNSPKLGLAKELLADAQDLGGALDTILSAMGYDPKTGLPVPGGPADTNSTGAGLTGLEAYNQKIAKEKDDKYNSLKVSLAAENPGWTPENVDRAAREAAYGADVSGGGGGGANLTTSSGGSTDAATQEKRDKVKTALEDFKANLHLYGLDSLADTIDGYIKDDLSAAQIKINIVGTDTYKARFPGMAALQKAGKAINEATYIQNERMYDQVLRAHGVDTAVFGTTEQYGKYIGNEVSPVEFENRVAIAKDRVDKNSDVAAALQQYYGVDKSAAIAYLLDPKLGMDVVQKQARAAEIGAAAAASGFTFGKFEQGAGIAESFVNASGTQDLQSLKTEFGKARNLADIQGRLSDIEGGKYTDLEAVTAILNQDQQLLLESQKRASREVARFSGGTGVGSMSLREASNI